MHFLYGFLTALWFEYAIAKVQENHGLKINGTCQLVAYTDGINLLKDNINSTQETQNPLV